MNACGNEAEAAEVTEVEGKAELERLFADPRFHATERSRSFLRYVSNEYFEGREAGVKAYSIAVDVLGRPCSFDPSLDPIVRIEATRLRSSLDRYYEAFAEQGSVTIQLPKGRYVPVFGRSTGSLQPGATDPEELANDIEDAVADDEPQMPRGEAAELRFWKWGFLLLAVFLAAGAYGGLAWFRGQPQFTEKPTITLAMRTADAALESEASATLDYLMVALSQFQTLRISSQRDRLDLVTASTVPTESSFRHSRPYSILFKYYGDAHDRSVWWQVVDSKSNEVLKSGVETIATDGRSAASVRDELVTVLSRRFATTRGVINNLETHEQAGDEVLGNSCVLRAEYALDDLGSDKLAEVTECLTRTLVAEPKNPDATATLARVLIASEIDAPTRPTLERALALANRSVSLAPLSDRANIALMIAQFFNGRTEAAINAGNRALALNPNNPEVSAKLGAVLFASGFWEAGVSLAEDAERSVDAVPRAASLVLALDAYRRGDYSEASLLAEQIPCSDYVVRVLRTAALGQLGSSEATDKLAELRRRDPDFETTFIRNMQSRRYEDRLILSLQDGLAKAGGRFRSAAIPHSMLF